MVYINSEANRSLPKNQQNSWNYKGSLSAGALTLGRGVWQNVGIATGGGVFANGPDATSIGSAAAGAWFGGKFGVYAPGIVNSVTGKEAPGFVFDAIGSLGTEFLGGYTKDLLNTPSTQNTSRKETEDKK